MVSRIDVVAAYRLILGREPESETVIREHAKAYATVADLGTAFRASDEFHELQAREAPASPDGVYYRMRRIAQSAAATDMIVKRIEFRPQVAGMLALPMLSDDPIVAAYAVGELPNDYMIDMLETLTRPGDQVLDLGAHVGTFCIPAALLGRQVLAVDASRRHVELIETSRRINGLQSLSVIHHAIVRQPGPVAFSEHGLFGAVDFGLTDADAVAVPGQRLAAILEENRIGPVSFIKMDIEGSELAALESISDRLERPDAPAILYESNEQTYGRAGFSVGEMRLWLEARGYNTFRIENGRWTYAPPDQPQPELWVDMLALKPAMQERFRDIIDLTWDPGAVRERCIEWFKMRNAGDRDRLINQLRDPARRSKHPELERLADELAAPQHS